MITKQFQTNNRLLFILLFCANKLICNRLFQTALQTHTHKKKTTAWNNLMQNICKISWNSQKVPLNRVKLFPLICLCVLNTLNIKLHYEQCQNMFTYWFLCVFKRLLDGRNLTVPILVDLFFCELLFDRHSNPRKKPNQDYIQYKHTQNIYMYTCAIVFLMLESQTYLTSTFSLETPYLLNSVEMYSVFLIHGTTLACCWDLNN